MFNKDYQSQVSYHERRTASKKVEKDKKLFSDGYLRGAFMIETFGGLDSASVNARKAKRLIDDPKASKELKQQAKGLIASLYDYKKTIPEDKDVWGRKMKTRRT
ncbi:MAG: hypothetical protein RBQ91_05950 [Acholeplasma sp.]|nr:hypothetical protein [Acholeplasma sp.]